MNAIPINIKRADYATRFATVQLDEAPAAMQLAAMQ